MGDKLAKQLADIRIDGFCIIPDAISNAQIETIKAQFAPYLQGEHMGRNNFEGEHTERVYALLKKAPAMAGLIEHEQIMPLLDALLPKNFLLSAALAINVHPGETPQPFHIDDAAGGLPWPKPRPMFGVSTIWALDDFTSDNGATEVVPGSQHWPRAQVWRNTQGCYDEGLSTRLRRTLATPRWRESVGRGEIGSNATVLRSGPAAN